MKLNKRDLQAVAAGFIAGLCAAVLELNYKDWQFYLFGIIAISIFFLQVKSDEN